MTIEQLAEAENKTIAVKSPILGFQGKQVMQNPKGGFNPIEVIWQVAVGAKSNEITAFPALLEMLSLKGRIVAADAMHTQRDTAQSVTGGDHVLALKGNQKALHEDVTLWLDDPANGENCEMFQHVDSGHGRIETRQAMICHDIGWLTDRHDWPGLKAIGKITAMRETCGKTTRQKGSMRGKLKRAGWQDVFMLDLIRNATPTQKR